MYHRLEVIGHLGNDPEMKYLANGKPVTKMSVATTRKYTKDDGVSVDETIWFRISVFGKQAEHCNTYLRKGRLVFVEGHLQADVNGSPKIFSRKDGTAGSSYEIIANNVKFLSSNDRPPTDSPSNEIVPVAVKNASISEQEKLESLENCPF